MLIKKVNSETRHYLYAVFSPENTTQLSYYVEFDIFNKKLLFFKDRYSVTPACTYDLIGKIFELQDEIIFPLINGRVVFKCTQAFEANVFPDDISWRS